MLGLIIALVLVLLMGLTAEPFEPDGYGPGQDARAYWAVPMDAPYIPGSVGHEGAYLYSPAFLQAMIPLRVLPWTCIPAYGLCVSCPDPCSSFVIPLSVVFTKTVIASPERPSK